MEFLDLDSTANRVNDGRDHNDFLRRTAVRHMSACLSMLQTSLSVGFKGSSLIVASETVDRHADQVAGSPVHSVEDLFSLSDQIQSQIDSFEDFCIDPVS